MGKRNLLFWVGFCTLFVLYTVISNLFSNGEPWIILKQTGASKSQNSTLAASSQFELFPLGYCYQSLLSSKDRFCFTLGKAEGEVVSAHSPAYKDMHQWWATHGTFASSYWCKSSSSSSDPYNAMLSVSTYVFCITTNEVCRLCLWTILALLSTIIVLLLYIYSKIKLSKLSVKTASYFASILSGFCIFITAFILISWYIYTMFFVNVTVNLVSGISSSIGPGLIQMILCIPFLVIANFGWRRIELRENNQFGISQQQLRYQRLYQENPDDEEKPDPLTCPASYLV